MESASTPYIIDVRTEKEPAELFLSHMRGQGFAVLRGLLSDQQLSGLNEKVNRILKRPSLSGSVGYYMKDSNKKIFDGLLLGREAVDAVSHPLVLDLVEDYLGGSLRMTEVFLKHDLGNDQIYFPYHCHSATDRTVQFDGPFGVGTLLYLHDTDEGAFCYSPGSQEIDPVHGEQLFRYPDDQRAEIMGGMCRISGLAGDVVLFDERGFHGPEQPVTTPRTAILYGYQRADYFDDTTRAPAPVVLNDLSHLNERQLRMLGLGAAVRTSYFDHHIRGYDRTRHYALLAKVHKALFRIDDLKNRARKLVGRGIPQA